MTEPLIENLDLSSEQVCCLHTSMKVIEAAIELTGLPREHLTQSGDNGSRRHRNLARMRFAVMWTLRQPHALSYPSIARRMGYMDHTSIIHGVREAERLRAENDDFKKLTDELLKRRLAA